MNRFVRDEAAGYWKWFDMTKAVVDRACTILERLPGGTILSSADALHLACALENGFDAVYTNDKRMLNACHHCGLEGINVIASRRG